MSSLVLSSDAPRASRIINWGRFAYVGLATVVAAVIANTLFYFIGDAIVGYDPAFVVLANVSGTIIFTVVPAIGAVLVYAALLRLSRTPERTFTIISGLLLVASVIPDFLYIPTVSGSTNGQIAILVLMHVIAAAVIVLMLTALARPRSR